MAESQACSSWGVCEMELLASDLVGEPWRAKLPWLLSGRWSCSGSACP